MYLYGRTHYNAASIKETRLDEVSCGQKWSGAAYADGHDSNTFTKSVMSCILGFSEELPFEGGGGARLLRLELLELTRPARPCPFFEPRPSALFRFVTPLTR